MVDMESYYERCPEEQPNLLEDLDCRRWSSDCACSICAQRTLHSGGAVASVFDSYNNITLESSDELTRHKYLLCPRHIPAFVFKLRKWGKSMSSVICIHAQSH